MLTADQRRDRARLMALAITPDYEWTCAKCGRHQEPPTVYWLPVDPSSRPDARLCFICCDARSQLAKAKLPLRYRFEDTVSIGLAIAKTGGAVAVGTVCCVIVTYFAFTRGGPGLLIGLPSAALMVFLLALAPAWLSEARNSATRRLDDETNSPLKAKINWGTPLPATAYLVASPLASGGAYFGSLRTVVMLTAGFYAATGYFANRPFSAVSLASVAIVFNPLVPVFLGAREAWLPLDVAALVAIWYAAFRHRDVLT